MIQSLGISNGCKKDVASLQLLRLSFSLCMRKVSNLHLHLETLKNKRWKAWNFYLTVLHKCTVQFPYKFTSGWNTQPMLLEMIQYTNYFLKAFFKWLYFQEKGQKACV